MRKFSLEIIVFILIAAGWNAAYSQTTVNPDISFIGDTRFHTHWQATPDFGINQPQFSFEELELAASSYLNPYARADLVLSVSGSGEADIEEAYATLLRGLPWNLQIKAGKYLVDFGKLNTQHAHAWSWIERPLMFQQFFGEEGFKGEGVNITTLIPVGTSAMNLSGSILQGGFLNSTFSPELAPPLAGNMRVSLFMPLSEHSETEFGISGLTAEHDLLNKRWAKMGDIDFKYKWKPDKYHSLVIVAEGLLNSRKISPDTLNPGSIEKVNSFGAFSSMDYQFQRRFDIGTFIDYSQSPLSKDIHQTGYGVFAGFALAEETYR
ncbi:MAG TPA: hypothetical protein DEO84_08215, partial [candidate division Zixibacteria bacterium]|nr:hypothetical protein [candidate division Zixibacteria bacterium]